MDTVEEKNWKDILYVVEKDNWYRLMVKDLYACVCGVSSYEKVKEVVRKYISTHRTATRFLKVIQNIEGLLPSPANRMHAEEEYNLGVFVPSDLNADLHRVIDEAVGKLRSTPVSVKPPKRSGGVLSPKVSISRTDKVVQERKGTPIKAKGVAVRTTAVQAGKAQVKEKKSTEPVVQVKPKALPVRLALGAKKK